MMILMVMMNVIMIWMFSSVGGYGAGGVDSEKGSPYNNIDNYGHLGGNKFYSILKNIDKYIEID